MRTCVTEVHMKNDIAILECGVHDHAPVHGKVTVAKTRVVLKQCGDEIEANNIVQYILTQISFQHAHLMFVVIVNETP